MPVSDETIAKLADPATQAIEVPDLVREATGVRPHLQIDLTDPPTPPCAIVGELALFGIDADQAMQKLGRTVARALEGEDVTALATEALAEADQVAKEMPAPVADPVDDAKAVR
jgi:hypothetical protein